MTRFEEAGEWFAAGLVHAALGNRDRAFGAFAKVESWGGMPTGAWPTLSMRYLYGDVLDPLRGDPRFGELQSEVNRNWGLEPDGSFPRAAQTAEA